MTMYRIPCRSSHFWFVALSKINGKSLWHSLWSLEEKQKNTRTKHTHTHRSTHAHKNSTKYTSSYIQQHMDTNMGISSSSSSSGNNNNNKNNNDNNGVPEVPTEQKLQQEVVVDPSSSSMGFSYAWPDSLHVELRDMAEVSFLIYNFAYLLEGARVAQKQQEEQGGGQELEITKALNELRTMVDATGNHVPRNDPDQKATTIMTVITPQKVETIVKNNFKVLEDLQLNGQLTRFWDTQKILDSLQRL